MPSTKWIFRSSLNMQKCPVEESLNRAPAFPYAAHQPAVLQGGRLIHTSFPALCRRPGFFYLAAVPTCMSLSCSCSRSAMSAINSLFVGFPFVLLTV